MVHERELSPQGIEVNFATNTLATFLLTEGLLDTLKKSDNVSLLFEARIYIGSWASWALSGTADPTGQTGYRS